MLSNVVLLAVFIGKKDSGMVTSPPSMKQVGKEDRFDFIQSMWETKNDLHLTRIFRGLSSTLSHGSPAGNNKAYYMTIAVSHKY